MRQIDSRWVDRAAGIEAVWSLDDEGFMVEIVQHVRSPQGEESLSTVYIGSDADEARDAYLHPFVRPRVRSPWEASEIVERVEEYTTVPI